MMKQIIATHIQTTLSIVEGDQRIFIETTNNSSSLIQVHTKNIHIQIQTGQVINKSAISTFDSFHVIKPFALPGHSSPLPISPNPHKIKPKPNEWFTKTTPTYISDLPIQTTEFVLLALKWCENNIEKTKRSYIFEIKYYKPKKTMGTYQYSSRKITVYVYPSLSLRSLCKTIIHEYAHHLHIKTKADQNEYDRLTRMHTYWNNPYEKLSRAYEEKYGSTLWEYMKEKISGKI